MKSLAIAGEELRQAIRSQAKLRLAVGLPMVICGNYLLLNNGISLLFGTVLNVNLVYISVIAALAFGNKIVSSEKIIWTTAVLDPIVMHSSMVAVLGEYGGLYSGFYLFTILGFGFRSGITLMRVCQASTIVGFVAVFFVSAFWRTHPIIWFSFLVMLLIVPGYAAVLLKKLHEARAEAEHESKAKSELLARVSHELRTPLTGIVAATQLMLLESQSTKTTKRAETILGMAKELTEEIEDLLDQAKYESSALVLESVPTSLHELLERVRLTIAPAASRKALHFDLNVDSNITDWVITDPHYLGRVLINLASNAVKFTPAGQVLIDARLLQTTKASYQIQFTVEDTGIGIAKEFHQRIFEPFYQVGGGTTRRFGGTGLGMAIAAEVVKTMGGEIIVDSEPGVGAKFRFVLSFPRIDSPQQASAGEKSQPTVLGKKILIVDDHNTNLLLLKELLEQDQHMVTTAKSAMEALTALNANEFDVAFFDYNLSDMDGAKLLQIYRFGKLKPAPVYFLTADATSVTAEKLNDSGATGILHKPVALHDLRKSISKVCRNEPNRELSTLPGTASHAAKTDRQYLRPVPVQILDISRIERLRNTSTRPGFIRELLTQSLSDIDTNCQLLVEALRTEDIESIRETAHALKGVCANIGAVRLVGLSSSLMATRRESFKQGNQLVNDLEVIRASTHDAIEQFILQLDSPAQGADLSAGLH